MKLRMAKLPLLGGIASFPGGLKPFTGFRSRWKKSYERVATMLMYKLAETLTVLLWIGDYDGKRHPVIRRFLE